MLLRPVLIELAGTDGTTDFTLIEPEFSCVILELLRLPSFPTLVFSFGVKTPLF